MANFVEKAWEMVNNAESRNDITKAEAFIRANIKDNDEFDELMMALSFKSRELYRHSRVCRHV